MSFSGYVTPVAVALIWLVPLACGAAPAAALLFALRAGLGAAAAWLLLDLALRGLAHATVAAPVGHSEGFTLVFASWEILAVLAVQMAAAAVLGVRSVGLLPTLPTAPSASTRLPTGSNNGITALNHAEDQRRQRRCRKDRLTPAEDQGALGRRLRGGLLAARAAHASPTSRCGTWGCASCCSGWTAVTTGVTGGRSPRTCSLTPWAARGSLKRSCPLDDKVHRRRGRPAACRGPRDER